MLDTPATSGLQRERSKYLQQGGTKLRRDLHAMGTPMQPGFLGPADARKNIGHTSHL